MEHKKQIKSLRQWFHSNVTVEQYKIVMKEASSALYCSKPTINNDLDTTKFIPQLRKEAWVRFIRERFNIDTSVEELFPQKL